MSPKFLLILLGSITLWSLSESFAIKDQDLVTDVEQSTVSLLNATSNDDNTSSSAIEIEKSEKLPIQTTEEEKNDTLIVKNDDDDDDDDLNTQKQEMLPTSTLCLNKMNESESEHVKDIEVMNVTTESDETEVKKDEDEEKKEYTDGDQEKTKFSTDKPTQHNELDVEEQEPIKSDNERDNVD